VLTNNSEKSFVYNTEFLQDIFYYLSGNMKNDGMNLIRCQIIFKNFAPEVKFAREKQKSRPGSIGNALQTKE
jgi:hypothetical protein